MHNMFTMCRKIPSKHFIHKARLECTQMQSNLRLLHQTEIQLRQLCFHGLHSDIVIYTGMSYLYLKKKSSTWWCCYITCGSNLDLRHSKYINYSKLASMFMSIKTQGVWVLTFCSSNFFFLTNQFRTTTSVFPTIFQP